MTRRPPTHLQHLLAAAELGAVVQDNPSDYRDVGTWARSNPNLTRYGNRWVKEYQETFGPYLPANWRLPLPPLPPTNTDTHFSGTEPGAIAQALQNPGPALVSLFGALASGRGGLAGLLGKALQSAGQGDALGAVAAALGPLGGKPGTIAQTLLRLSATSGPGRDLAKGLLDVASGKLPPVDLLRGLAGANLPQVLGAFSHFLPPRLQKLIAQGPTAALPPKVRQLVQTTLPLVNGSLPRALSSVAESFVPPQLRPILRAAQQVGSVERILRLPLPPFLPRIGQSTALSPLHRSPTHSTGGSAPWAARMSDARQCPKGAGVILSPCAPTVLLGNLPAARQTDLATCSGGPPDSVAKGESTVLINGQPAARIGDPTSHGGSVVAGLATVWIGKSTTGKLQCMKLAAQNGAATIAQLDGGA